MRSLPIFRLLPSNPGRMKSAGNSAAAAARRDGRAARTPVDDSPAHESGPMTRNPSGGCVAARQCVHDRGCGLRVAEIVEVRDLAALIENERRVPFPGASRHTSIASGRPGRCRSRRTRRTARSSPRTSTESPSRSPATHAKIALDGLFGRVQPAEPAESPVFARRDLEPCPGPRAGGRLLPRKSTNCGATGI